MDIIFNVKKIALLTAGTISTALGIIGIILPILPTTPFLLLAAACYIRSSYKFYYWLTNNKCFGSYIKNYIEKKGIPLPTKIYALLFLWVSIIFSAIFFVQLAIIKILMFMIAAGVSVHILSIKTIKNQSADAAGIIISKDNSP